MSNDGKQQGCVWKLISPDTLVLLVTVHLTVCQKVCDGDYAKEKKCVFYNVSLPPTTVLMRAVNELSLYVHITTQLW